MMNPNWYTVIYVLINLNYRSCDWDYCCDLWNEMLGIHFFCPNALFHPLILDEQIDKGDPIV